MKLAVALLSLPWWSAIAATTLPFYFGHTAVADRHGVIAPWYKAQNGQFDYRIRVAAETLKRYPWAGRDKAVSPAPEYVYNGKWSIDQDGNILPGHQSSWNNGDVGQRSAVVLSALIDYYAYSGDPAAFTPITANIDYLIDHCQTPANHGWPKILISVPNMGKLYGDCVVGTSDELKGGHGKIQLDLVAQVGIEVVRAYELTGNTRWFEAAKHWGDLLAANRRREAGAAPWGRYANNAKGNGMNGIQTGGISIVLSFFEELIRAGYTGKNNEIVAARDAGRAWLRDVLLPVWTRNDTFGRNFWDWEAPVQDRHCTEKTTLYMMDHKDYFPNWKTDVRNILTLYMNHNSVNPNAKGEVYNGAWAYPESSSCCQQSLWYPTMAIASVFARYGAEAASEWAREIARRSQILTTYDPGANGYAMDLIDGGSFVAARWFKNAQPKPIKDVLRSMAWQPEITGASRENHIMRTAGVVRHVVYDKGAISYSMYDAPPGSVDVLRLAFEPVSVTADGKALAKAANLDAAGYTVRPLGNGDAIVSIRHDGATAIVVKGEDPQSVTDDKEITFDKGWTAAAHKDDGGGSSRVTSQAGASVTFRFSGNQVRLIAPAVPTGGLADVYIDDFKQLVPIDFHCPQAMRRQVLYYRNGLVNGPHTIRIVARGARNPLSKGDEVYVDAFQHSSATGETGFGEGGGPTDTQRMIFGYTERQDYIDSAGNAWKPGAEFVARTGAGTDVVAKTWWTYRQSVFVAGTKDEELYRYGVHWKDFAVNVTVGPGKYYARLMFAENQFDGPRQRAMTIEINGKKMLEGFDVFATAGAARRAVDLVFNGIEPKDGVIEIRLAGDDIQCGQAEAMLQALEVGPGDGGSGAVPLSVYVQGNHRGGKK